jgi:hypothetical protein
VRCVTLTALLPLESATASLLLQTARMLLNCTVVASVPSQMVAIRGPLQNRDHACAKIRRASRLGRISANACCCGVGHRASPCAGASSRAALSARSPQNGRSALVDIAGHRRRCAENRGVRGLTFAQRLTLKRITSFVSKAWPIRRILWCDGSGLTAVARRVPASPWAPEGVCGTQAC